MKTLYLQCNSGISGDMFVGALLDLTKEKKYLLTELRKIPLSSYGIKISKTKKKGIPSTLFQVIPHQQKIYRYLTDIYDLIDKSTLTNSVKILSKKMFLSLAKAESEAHQIPLEKVHFHEVGAIDSILDIISACILIDKLNVQRIISSPLTDGHGTITYEHGTTTLPVPAVKTLLKNAPQRTLNINSELTTPTGAVILTTLTSEFMDDCPFTPLKKGCGAGTKDFDHPNVLEVFLGNFQEDTKIILQTHLDDMSAELCSPLIDLLLSKGATDAFIQPIFMKKNRLGFMLTVVCAPELKESFITFLFKETTTFGIRIQKTQRIILERSFQKIKTPLGVVNFKIGKYKGKIMTIKPEYEDCKKISLQKNMPLKKVYARVIKHTPHY